MDGLIKTVENIENDGDDFSFKDYFVPLTTVKAIIWIIIIGIIVFCNGLFNGFVMDDNLQIVNNTIIHSLSNFFLIFSGSTFYNGAGQLTGQFYRPLVSVCNILVYVLFGPHAFFFHLVQILLVITNACLFFVVFKHFFKIYISLILSLIFLVHPI